MNRMKGFTLVELMVVLAILAIVAFIAVPNFTTLVRDNRVEAQAEELNALFQYARSEAVIRKIDTFVTINATTGEISVRPTTETNTEILRTSTIDVNTVSLDVSATTVSYRSNGTTTTPGFKAVLCNQNNADTGRLLTISASGSTTLHHKGKDSNGTALGSCSA